MGARADGANLMTEPVPIQPTLASPAEQTFPTLTPAQMARIAAHGSRRAVRPGEVPVEAGAPVVPFFLVASGRLEIVRPAGAAATLVATVGPGQFTGEVTMLSGRRALNRIWAPEPGEPGESPEVVELDRESLLTLVQT